MKLNLFFLSATAMVNAAIGTNPVELGTAGDYAILSKAGITTTPGSDITGNIAVSPIAHTAMTGFNLALAAGGKSSKSLLVTGEVKAANYAVPTPSELSTAVGDMMIAYTDAKKRTPNFIDLNSGGIGGQTLTAGVYKFGTAVSINTDVTLKGGPNDVFIIQIAGALTQAAGKSVILRDNDGILSTATGYDGPQAENIFWQVVTTVTVGKGAHMEGVILAMTAVTFMADSTLNGRILGQTSVVLQSATITEA